LCRRQQPYHSLAKINLRHPAVKKIGSQQSSTGVAQAGERGEINARRLRGSDTSPTLAATLAAKTGGGRLDTGDTHRLPRFKSSCLATLDQ